MNDILRMPLVLTVALLLAGSAIEGRAQAPAAAPGTIQLNFRGAPLDAVLDHLSEAAGFVIVKEATLTGTVDVWSHQALTPEDALELLNTVLATKQLAAVRTGRTLRIVTADKAKTYSLPVASGRDPKEIPQSDAMVTQIIPVRHADAAKLIANLESLLTDAAVISANESSNALILTDTQTHVRRIAEIVAALDTSISSVSEIRVFPLEHADAEKLAEVVNKVFDPSAAADTQSSDARARGMRRFFMRVRGGGEDSSQAAGSGAQAAATKVTAVADTHSNSLVVGAPGDLLDDVELLVRSVDVATEETQQLRVFPLQYADAETIAASVNRLFAQDTNGSGGRQDQASRRTRARPRPPSGSDTRTTQRSLEETRVTAVADTRTNSVIVSASDRSLDMIEAVVRALDETPKNIAQVYVYRIAHADLETLREMLQGMFEDLEETTTGGRAATGGSGATALGRTQVGR